MFLRPLLAGLILALAPTVARAALADSPAAARPLAVGAAAPTALLRAPDGTEQDLGTALRGRRTVLVFYRGGWCPYCSKHLAALAEAEPALLELGWQILALSPDEPAALRPTMEKNKVAYRLLSDRAMRAAPAYGVAFRVDAETVRKYRGYGVELPPVPDEPADRWLPVPAVFLIDRDGRVRFVHADADYSVRLEPDALLAAARAVR